MKRKKPLDPGSKPLKRTPLKRSSPLKATLNGRPRSNLKPQSDKRRAENPARTAVRAATIARAGGKCQAAEIVPEIVCGGPLDTDEIKGRGVNPGGHLDLENTQALCRRHHDWKHANPAEARRRGLRKESWET